MDSSIVSGLIGGLASVVICAYISAKVRGSAEHGTLRFGAWLVVLAWCCLALAALAASALFIDANVWQDRGELIAVVGLIVGFGAGAGYCFAEYFLTRGTYDDNGIDFHTPWTGRKTERWGDLAGVELNAQSSWYVLTFRSGNKIRISSLLGGNGRLMSLLEGRGFALNA
jgi:hypothetical protein